MPCGSAWNGGSSSEISPNGAAGHGGYKQAGVGKDVGGTGGVHAGEQDFAAKQGEGRNSRVAEQPLGICFSDRKLRRSARGAVRDPQILMAARIRAGEERVGVACRFVFISQDGIDADGEFRGPSRGAVRHPESRACTREEAFKYGRVRRYVGRLETGRKPSRHAYLDGTEVDRIETIQNAAAAGAVALEQNLAVVQRGKIARVERGDSGNRDLRCAGGGAVRFNRFL